MMIFRTVLTTIAFLSSLTVAAASEPPAIQPDYSRDTAPVLPVERPTPDAVPEILRVDADTAEIADPAGLSTRATLAAAASAETTLDAGRQQAYNVGFYAGLHRALAAAPRSGADFQAGVEYGRRDPQARFVGLRDGRLRAAMAAGAAAAAQVAAERGEEAPTDVGAPVYDGSTRAVRPPRLADVVAARPVADLFDHRWARALPDALELASAPDAAAVYASDWSAPEAALATWRRDADGLAFWQQLNDGERQLFESLFAAEQSVRLAAAYPATAKRFYSYGFDDGWRYGSVVAADWSYRQGYYRGFTTLLTRSTESAYYELFPGLLSDRYDELQRAAEPTVRRAATGGAPSLP